MQEKCIPSVELLKRFTPLLGNLAELVLSSERAFFYAK